MKRTLSLLLALVMVLGTFTTVFAAPDTAVEKAELLESLGILRGKGDGNLALEDDLRREEALVMLSRLLGEEEEAEEFPVGEDFPFTDVKGSYYPPIVAWALANEYTRGVAETRFGFEQPLKAQQYAAFLLRALGYEEEEDVFDDALALALELGLLEDVDVANDTVVKRSVMAVLTYNALGTPVNGSEETLAEKLDIEMPEEEVELSTDIELTAAKAVANDKVEVKVKEEVDASVADFEIVKKGTTTEVEVKGLVKESAKVFVLETEALTAGTAYTVTSNGKSVNFTGVAVDKTAPTVQSVKGTDTNRFEIEFSDVMDKVTAEDVENYVFDKDLKVVNASLDGSRKVVELETDSAKRNTTYRLTIENVENSDGVVMKKASFNVRALEYKTAPTIIGNPKVLNTTLVELKFNAGDYGMNVESLEDLANYEIDGLAVVEATAYDLDDDGLFETVLLETEEQEALKSYKLKVTGLIDDSVLANELRERTLSFRALATDKTGPDVKSVKAANADRVTVMFVEVSAMDIASMTDISNYRITYKDGGDTIELGITEAVAKGEGYPNTFNEARKGVTLYTEEQDTSKNYTIEISDIVDEYGNPMKLKRTFSFRGSEEDLEPPYVEKVEHTDKGVVIKFSEPLNKAIAVDPTNYVINNNVGAAVKATINADLDKVTLTTPALTSGKAYSISINNIEDQFGNVMPTRNVSFVARNTTIDTTAPTFGYAYAANKYEVHVSFDELIGAVTFTPANAELEIKNTTTGAFGDSSINLSEVGRINDGTTVVFVTDAPLTNDEYRFKSIEFADEAGNKVDIDGKTFQGTSSDNTEPTIEYVDQEDVKTIIVTFSEQVKVTGPVIIKQVGGAALTSSDVYKADTTDNTHEVEWVIEFPTKLEYGKDYQFQTLTAKDLSDEDVVNKGITTDDFTFVANLYDDVAPSVVGVEATHENRIVIEYDEDLERAGAYKVYYYNNNNVAVTVATGSGTVIGATPNKVALTASVDDLSKVYYLQTTVGAEDYAGNREVIDGYEWNFQGSKVKRDDSYISGVTLINARTIEVRANFDLSTAPGVTVSGDVYVDTITLRSSNTIAAIKVKVPFLAGKEYTVTAASGETFVFEGLISDREIELLVDGTVKTNGVEADDALFDNEILGLDGEAVVTPLTAGTEYYVLLKDVNSGAVLYAAKVEAE